METSSLDERIAALAWNRMAAELDERGFTTSGPLLSAAECRDLAGLYGQDPLFRSTVVMQRHAYGRGEYRYFNYPLPSLVETLRHGLYPQLATRANHWQTLLDEPASFPSTLADWLGQCHEAGQTKPTPLLLRYGPDDYNCLHRDLYGDHVFPLQATVLLSAAGEAFTGGEFVLVEQRPRQQSVAEVVPLRQGEAVIFAVNRRPARSARGYYRAAMRHGVSRLHSGSRHTLGIIFHDAA